MIKGGAMYLSEQERFLKDLVKAVNNLTEAVEAQNKLLNDVIQYPADMKQPPYLLVGAAEHDQI